MSTSTPVSTGSMRVLTSSLRRRRSLFLSTMIRPYFGTTTPTLAHDDGEAAIRTSSTPVFTRFPVRLTSSMSEARASLCARAYFRLDVSRPCYAAASCLRAGVLRRQLHRQTLAPLLAATRQYFTTPARGHPLTESMRLDPSLVTRTVRRLTHDYSLYTGFWYDLRKRLLNLGASIGCSNGRLAIPG